MFKHDLTGRTFGLWSVAGFDKKHKGENHWKCVCSCGRERSIPVSHLNNNRTRCCHWCSSRRFVKHGMTRTRTYISWRNMIVRCENKNAQSYPRYGGAGVSVCERWHDFSNFISDMGICPSGYTIDRINSLGNYEPGNCRWATPKEQALNRKSNIMVEINGITKAVSEHAKEYGIRSNLAYARISKGWDPKAAITTKPYEGR